MDQGAYFDQVNKRLSSLMVEGKYREAHRICLTLMAKFPDNKKLIKIRKQIEKTAAKKNKEIIKEKLEGLEKNWQTKDYSTIITELRKLLVISANNDKLKSMIIKAQQKYKNEINKQAEQFGKRNESLLKKLLKAKEDKKLIQEIERLEYNHSNNIISRKLTMEYRKRLVRRKIKDNSDLLYSDKYEAIHSFIEQLQAIDPANEEIEVLKRKVRERQHGDQITNKKEYIYKALNHITTLIQLEKNDKAIQACQELLQKSPGNKKATKLYKKAIANNFKQNRDFTVSLLNMNKAKEEETKFNPDTMVKI